MMRVLVIDDDAASISGLRRLLELDGFDVTATASSVDALARIRCESFDTVLTDLEMPDVHGLDIVRAATSASPRIPVIVMTAYAESPVAAAATCAGASRVLDKPLDYDALVGVLRSRA